MECPLCRSKDITILAQWVRQCQHCAHRWAVTRHTERLPKPHPDNKAHP